ncbi:MAG: hypothetical protein VB855_00490, partial [Pirellulaceae bacterium]
ILGDDKPRGGNRVYWNILMGVSVLGAIAAALTAIIDKASHPIAGPVVIGVGIILLVAIAVGFFLVRHLKDDGDDGDDGETGVIEYVPDEEFPYRLDE